MSVRKSRFEIYAASDGYRWRLRAANNNIIADGGEAYVQRGGATRSVNRLKKILSTQEVVVSHLGPK